MITTEQYFGKELVSPEIADNAKILLLKVNTFLELYSKAHGDREVKMTSGFRSPEYNKTIPNAAPNSKHMSGQAVDIFDGDKELARFCLQKVRLLEEYGLFCEDMRCTRNWVHFQSIPPRSGSRFFIPTLKWAARLKGPLTLESL